MRASELRIGNYVSVDNQDSWRNLEGVTLVVTGINNHMDTQDKEFFPDSDGKVNLKSEFETYGQFSQFIAAIPLTEKWLLKFGFEKKSWKSKGIVIECFYYEKNGIVIYIIEKGFEIEVKHGDDQFNLFRVWNYVHQLQNLYFALCGEELELK